VKERHEPVWLSRVIELLHTEFTQRLTLDYVATSVGVHPLHLSKVFRQFRNEAIGEYTHRLRIQFCCQQLADPQADLATVALAAGFADQSHFTRVFKHFTGSTPGAFRTALGVNAPLHAKPSLHGQDTKPSAASAIPPSS
jgi:AraC family transcriptional regulator